VRRSILAIVAVLAALWAPPASADGTRIAVLYFENQGNPELEMLKLGLAQMLITDLAPQPDLEVIERSRLNEILGELELQKTAVVDADSAVKVGKVLGVEFLIQGYYLYFEPVDSLVVGAQIVSVETGAVVGGFRTQGKQSEFLDLEAKLVAGLLPTLRGTKGGTESESGAAPKEEKGDVKAAPSGGLRRGGGSGGGSRTATASAPPEPEPSTVDAPDEGAGADEQAMAEAVADDDAAPVDSLGAALAFSEGLDALDRRDIPRAREALRRAVELDPTLDDARTALAEITL